MNGPWHTVHTEQMFLIIVVVVITGFFFSPSEVHAGPTQMKGITSTLFWNSTWPSSWLQAALNQGSMADNFPHDSPPPYASLFLPQHIPHLVVI